MYEHSYIKNFNMYYSVLNNYNYIKLFQMKLKIVLICIKFLLNKS